MPSIAVIGASADRKKFGNKCVRAYAQAGWTVYPINPKEKQIEGLQCFNSILQAPKADVASLYLPPQLLFPILDEIAKAGVKKVYFNPGTESPQVLEKARSLGLEALVACSIRAIGADPEQP